MTLKTQKFECFGCDGKIKNPEKFRCKIAIPFDSIDGLELERLHKNVGCVVLSDNSGFQPDWKLVSETVET